MSEPAPAVPHCCDSSPCQASPFDSGFQLIAGAFRMSCHLAGLAAGLPSPGALAPAMKQPYMMELGCMMNVMKLQTNQFIRGNIISVPSSAVPSHFAVCHGGGSDRSETRESPALRVVWSLPFCALITLSPPFTQSFSNIYLDCGDFVVPMGSLTTILALKTGGSWPPTGRAWSCALRRRLRRLH